MCKCNSLFITNSGDMAIIPETDLGALYTYGADLIESIGTSSSRSIISPNQVTRGRIKDAIKHIFGGDRMCAVISEQQSYGL